MNSSSGSLSRRMMPMSLTINKKFSSNSFRRRVENAANVSSSSSNLVIVEPELAAETAQRETQEVQVPLSDSATPQERFAAARALYEAWANALVDTISSYQFGSSKSEIHAVALGVDARCSEIETLNAEQLALLEEIYVFCLDVDDSLPKHMEPRVLGARVVDACAQWRRRAVDILQSAATLESEKSLHDLSAAQVAGVEVNLEKKLEQALLDGHGEEDEDGGEEEGEEEEEEEEEGAGGTEEGNKSPAKLNEAELKEMEERSAALAAERERMAMERKKSKTENILLRVSSAMEMERKQSLEEAIAIAESPRIIQESIAFVQQQEKEESDDKLAKATADEGAAHRAEIEKLKEKNEGLVQRLAELSQKTGDEAEASVKVEHRAEIEKLKQEGESLKARMARMEEERRQAQAQAQAASNETRQELERMREQQKGKAKKQAKQVLSPEEKLEQHLLHREEIEKMRTERANVTRQIGSDILLQGQLKSPRGELDENAGRGGGGGDVAKKFLSEQEQREREREEALLNKYKDLDVVVGPEVSDRLAAIEKSLQAIEEQKIDFQKRVEEMEKKRSSRSRMREEQMSLQKRREEEKKKEQDEYAQFQAEQKRKLEERQRARDIKNKAAKGLIPKLRLCLVGPKSGKSALAKRFMDGTFVEGQKEAAIDKLHEKPYSLKGSDYVIELLDTTSMEDFASLRHGFLAVFDLTRKPSRAFKQLRAFGEDIKKAKEVSDLSKVPIVVVATKEDLFELRKCKAGDAVAFAKEWGARYVEVSAKTGENVVAAFDTLIALCAAAKQEKASQAT